MYLFVHAWWCGQVWFMQCTNHASRRFSCFWSNDGNRDICVRRCPHMKYFVLPINWSPHLSIFHYKNKLISLLIDVFIWQGTDTRQTLLFKLILNKMWLLSTKYYVFRNCILSIKKRLLRETRIDELLSLIDHTDLQCISISVNWQSKWQVTQKKESWSFCGICCLAIRLHCLFVVGLQKSIISLCRAAFS